MKTNNKTIINMQKQIARLNKRVTHLESERLDRLIAELNTAKEIKNISEMIIMRAGEWS